MRENIGLFRGKRLDNGEWVEGYLSQHTMIDCNGSRLAYVIEPVPKKLWVVESFEVDPATVGENPGLKDKNGVRMWEGSIVTGMFRFGLPFNAVVSFQEGAFGLKWYGRDKEGKKVGWFEASTSISNVEFEVIGNVVDNPELLEV